MVAGMHRNGLCAAKSIHRMSHAFFEYFATKFLYDTFIFEY